MSFFFHIVYFIDSFSAKLCSIIYFNILCIFGINNIDLPFIIALLLIGYIVLTFKLRFIQFTKLRYSIKYAFRKKKDKKEGDISSLKTLLASVAGCTGMNAIAGMVFMVSIGGPGTAFWMPILAFLCMPFRFAEVYLSHSYRGNNNGEVLGGPFDYIKKGLGSFNLKKLGVILSFLYAFIMIFCGVTGLAMYETNQCVSVLANSFSFLSNKKLLLSTIVTIVLLFILIGGTKRIIKMLSTVLPILAISYLVASLIVIFVNIDKLWEAIVIICKDAIHPRAIAGGFLASLCMCARKVSLAHETGLGTSGIVHASSSEKDSIKEATSSMMTPLINCFCVCMMSALVLVITGFYKDESTKDGAVAIFKAFGSVSSILPYLITILIPMLAFNVLVGWSNYVIKCSKYCFKSRNVINFIMILFLISAFIGGNINDFNLIMQVVDGIMMLLIIINVPIIIALSGKVWKSIEKYNFKDK